MIRGFILQSTYRMERGRAVVWLLGKLEDGRTFLVRDGRVTSELYVRERDIEVHKEVCQQLGLRGYKSDRVSMRGESLLAITADLPKDLPLLAERIHRRGIETFEADLRLPMRYLIDRGLRGAIEIRGEPADETSAFADVVFDEPELSPTRFAFMPTLLSIDIETDMQAEHLLSVALRSTSHDEVLLLRAEWPGVTPLQYTTLCDSEAALISLFLARVKTLNPDVITGWNVIDFDLSVLAKIAGRHRIPFELGRLPGESRLRARGFWFSPTAHVPGRVVLDALQLMRESFQPMEGYSLDFVARQVLGEGKTIHAGEGRGEEIQRLYRDDPHAFVDYNRKDAQLVLDIVHKQRLIELTVERSLLTGMPLERVTASIASFDFLYLEALHRRGMVAPTVMRNTESVETTGGLVLEPLPGLHDNVWVLDFKSLYPSVIRTFQIDPLGFLQASAHASTDVIQAPNGATFSREPGILPRMLDALFPEREAAKQRGDDVTSHAIKILMNSFYGVLGAKGCRFHSSEVSNAITSFGRELLLWTKAHIETRGHEVLYGDTDSLFVRSNCRGNEEARDKGIALVLAINTALQKHIAQRYRVSSKLELQFESLYVKLWLQQKRSEDGGARKRYSGMLENGEIEFVGLEAVRRDWTTFAKDAQRELYRRLFRDEPVEHYVRDLVEQLQAGALDSQLVYKKALRKPLETYTVNTPPHVAAARKLHTPPGRLIHYVMTVAGPEPVEEVRHPLDYAHYIDKQLRAVADPVLHLLGLRFDALVPNKGGRQLSLFD